MDWFGFFCIVFAGLLAFFLPNGEICDLSLSLPDKAENIVLVGEVETGYSGHSASHKSFFLPGDADLENITAREKNGVITIIVPRKA